MVDGKNVSILAYGQTGAGKTFTMEGPDLSSCKEVNAGSGILPRTVHFIFEEMNRLQYKEAQILLELACMEIYNDEIMDLLAEEINFDTSKSKLSIVFNGRNVIIRNLTWKKIENYYQLFSLITTASARRSTDTTQWNERFEPLYML